MAPKRKNDTGSNPQTARERKRQKVTAARTIAVQNASSTASPGPSTFTNASSANRLPGAIDVEKFTEARAFEIAAMENAMKNASASSTHRVWQTLPRHLRRRAASHDVRRVPIRLRDKARAEMDSVRKKSKSKVPKRGRARKLTRTETLLKRQHDKLWLESHLWHAKRMKMENKWGYRLAIYPTEKSFRPSYRASVQGSILHDASYLSVVELKGPQKYLEAILRLCCDPQAEDPSARRCTVGSRSIETHMYKPGSYPFDMLTPVTILWQPSIVHTTDTANTSSPATSIVESHRVADIQQNDMQSGNQTGRKETSHFQRDTKYSTRVIWLTFHPAVFNEVFSALQEAASLVLDAAKREKAGEGAVDIEIADLRGHLNIFEIMGPKTNQVLKGALKPVPQDNRASFLQFWSELSNLPCSGSLPRNMVIGFKVIDPRLQFPPKNAKSKPNCVRNGVVIPSENLAQSEIWDEVVRLKLSKPRYKKLELDQRRSKVRAKFCLFYPGRTEFAEESIARNPFAPVASR
ncbi:hypothetical protein AX17_004999 [Amanita inopinata Kibby_2008]|nr:hypothetical protein AX17_004999 [Amanita inopinata Kibby_2008]